MVIPFVWAIAAAEAREAVHEHKIVALAIGGAAFSLILCFAWDVGIGQNSWFSVVMLSLIAIEYFGVSWVAVIWAHLDASNRPSAQRGFPVILIERNDSDDQA